MPQERKRWLPYCKSGNKDCLPFSLAYRTSVLLLGREINVFLACKISVSHGSLIRTHMLKLSMYVFVCCLIRAEQNRGKAWSESIASKIAVDTMLPPCCTQQAQHHTEDKHN
eukprot:1145245-Pelagomonas_calceolata.AAC.1